MATSTTKARATDLLARMMLLLLALADQHLKCEHMQNISWFMQNMNCSVANSCAWRSSHIQVWYVNQPDTGARVSQNGAAAAVSHDISLCFMPLRWDDNRIEHRIHLFGCLARNNNFEEQKKQTLCCYDRKTRPQVMIMCSKIISLCLAGNDYYSHSFL